MPLIAEILLVSVIVGIGSVIHGSVGIGLGLVAGPILTLIDPSFVPGPLLLSGLLLTILMAYRERKSIDFAGVKTALLGRVVGIILASVVMVLLPKKQMTILFGILVLFAVIISLSNIQIQPTGLSISSVGILSGFLSTTAGLGGPPMALLYQNTTSARLRSTLSGYLVFGTLLSLLSLIIVQKFGYHELKLFLIMCPGILLGYIFSTCLISFFDVNNLSKKSVLLISTVSAIVVIIRAFV
jgi:uncharacterized membrane protein YfcA